MNMQFVITIFEILKGVSLSYGQMFTLLGTILERGKTVATATLETLSTEKYAPVKAHFQKALLLVIAAMAELKKGKQALEKAYKENPDDFKELNSFLADLKTQIPESLEGCMGSVVTVFQSIDPAEVKKWKTLPAFIRESGEYMDLINVSATEVTEMEFKFWLQKSYKISPVGMMRELHRVKNDLSENGWTAYAMDDVSYVFWADDLDITNLIPEGFVVVEPTEENKQNPETMEVGGVLYKWQRPDPAAFPKQ